MVKLWLCALLLATGCFDDRYRCTEDSQCDLGDGGRCEVDGLCTHFDVTCPTQRRYSAHAGELTNACFDDRVTPLDACAGGQPPAKPEGCFAAVCERLPACCDLAWTDACAQIAQEACTNFRCDTRIAINASRGVISDRFEATWDGSTWTFANHDELGEPLAWIAPAPGSAEPRLASTTAAEIVVGSTPLAVPEGRTYASITSIGFDRDLRDTVVASYSDAAGQGIEIWKVESQQVRDAPFTSSAGLVWGDDNRDSFPDAIVKGGTSYTYLDDVDGSGHVRKLLNETVANTSGGATPGAPGVRSMDWLDLDGDGKLDLAVFGASLRIHTRADDLSDQAQYDLDCDPPSIARTCMADPEPNLEQTSFAGAALPTAAGPSLLAAVFPDRKLYRVSDDAGTIDVSRVAFPGDSCSCTKNCSATLCPGPDCTCTYDCASCVPIVAIVTRDLDGDHVLDIVAIDAKLQLYTALAAANYKFTAAMPIVSPLPPNYSVVNVSVTGAVSP